VGALRDGAQLSSGPVRTGLASAAGSVLAVATRTIASLRPAEKPLHPDGVVRVGRIDRRGSAVPSGVAWIDDPGQDDVVVRLSRAVGLPKPLPDIHGLALRIPTAEGAGDLLLASTGWGRLGRFVLTFGRRPGSRPLTSLLPYRTASGPVLLGARAVGSGSYELFWAPYDGDWLVFATLTVTDQPAKTRELSFDPVLNQLPGLEQYPTVVRLREPAYGRARASR
jgi:hypothetical protein